MSRRLSALISAFATLLLIVSSVQPAAAAGPQISVVSLSKSSLSRGDSIRVEYRITDDGNGCCNPHDVYVYDPNGAWVTRVQGAKISGTASNSTWRADITIPVNSVGQNQGTPLMAGTYTFRTQTTDSQINWTDLVLLGTASVVVASPSATPRVSASPSATPRVSVTPSATPRVSVTPSATPRVSVTPSATPRTSTTPRATATPAEEIDLEPEEEVYESSIEAKFTNGRTRFVVSGIPSTKYKVEATLRQNKATFSTTTGSSGEVIFRSTRNLKNYKIKLILGTEVVATATVE